MTKTELLEIAKPILFSTDMVRAILGGRKTVTRRVLKVPSKYKNIPSVTARLVNINGEIVTYTKGQPAPIIIPHPHQVGDVLYVRETWEKHPKQDIFYYRADSVCNGKSDERGCPEPYDKTNNCILCDWCDGFIKWRPSIHMPKSAARIFLKVTGVRVERLQDITAEQIDAEGCKEYGYNAETGKLMPSRPTWFKIIWDNTIKKQDLDKYSWEANPWVWVHEFERMEHDG